MTYPEPTEFDIGCFFHGFEGDITPEKQPYRVCGECGHIYWTSEQLLTEYNTQQAEAVEGLFPGAEVVEETDPDQVFFCGWCAHDF